MREKKSEPRDIPIIFDGEEVGSNSEEGSDLRQEAELAASGDQQQKVVTAADEDSDDASVAAEPQRETIAQLQSQIDALTAEKASLYDKLLRRQAEFENYRKRVDRERGELYQHGRDDVLLQFLPVVDNFERALFSLETSEGDAEALRHGVELIHRQFKDALSKLGLEAVEAVGQTFDPHVHEAVTTEATDKHKENTVIQEFQRGYRIGDRLLRPAKVKVASSPEK
ncbi:MAG TPA: nucleotide exchange factor GrpE [Blastocatellia bacterium]|nr:nucleotide exchange factor GrpE [Blastocatellia bacterium]